MVHRPNLHIPRFRLSRDGAENGCGVVGDREAGMLDLNGPRHTAAQEGKANVPNAKGCCEAYSIYLGMLSCF